jgi:hypothetical protein
MVRIKNNVSTFNSNPQILAAYKKNPQILIQLIEILKNLILEFKSRFFHSACEFAMIYYFVYL